MGKVITVAQQKGGSGKTTLSACLALGLAGRNLAVAIVDTDPQGSLGRWFMARKETMGDDGPDLGFRTASAWGARYEARELLKSHDVVVIDTPPKMGVDGRPAIEGADLVVVPVTPSNMDVWATEPTVEMALAEKKPVLLVLNRVSARTRLADDIRERLAGMGGRLCAASLGNRVRFAEALGNGRSPTDGPRSDMAAREVRSLVDEIALELGFSPGP